MPGGLGSNVGWAASVLIQLALAVLAQCFAAITVDAAEKRSMESRVVEGETKKPALYYFSPFTRFSVGAAPYLFALAAAGSAIPWVLARKGKGSLFALTIVNLLVFLAVFSVILVGFALALMVFCRP